MRTLSFTLAFWGVLAAGFAEAVSTKYPFVVEVQGQVQWWNKNDEEAKLKPRQIFIEKARLQTGGNGQILVQIDAQRQFRVLPKSQVEIPSISWETGEAPIVDLKYGSFRWKEKAGKKYNTALRSDLFEFISPVGDFVFSFDPAKAFAEVKAIEGSMEFSATNAEDVALVTAGQKVAFQGVREGNELVYDVLLKGKKIPRGKLGLVEAFSPADKKRFSAAEARKEEALRRQKEAAVAKAKIRVRDPLEICEKPFGKLNHCAWVCEGNPKSEKKRCRLENPGVRCVRTRCNANGEWAESTEISREKAVGFCAADIQVKICDY